MGEYATMPLEMMLLATEGKVKSGDTAGVTSLSIKIDGWMLRCSPTAGAGRRPQCGGTRTSR
jgi:hypothetical protein